MFSDEPEEVNDVADNKNEDEKNQARMLMGGSGDDFCRPHDGNAEGMTHHAIAFMAMNSIQIHNCAKHGRW